MVKIRDFRKEFKKCGFVLSCFHLDVETGDSIGICGGIVSGKTLFTKTLAGLTGDYSGSVEIARSELKRMFKKKIGYVPFRNHLYSNLTLKEMSFFLLRQYRSGVNEFRVKSEWFAKYFGVAELAESRIGVLTDGQLQWFKIFCALLHSPQVLIIDEPFNGLGSGSLVMLKELVYDLKAIEVTVLMTSSSRDLISGITDSITEINNGTVG